MIYTAKKPLVTIVTITKNLIKTGRIQNIEQCIRSVQEQTYDNFEHLIIDGASSDGTIPLLHMLTKDSRVECKSEPDSGIYEAMNKGLSLAKGKYVTFLHSDDYYNSSLGIEQSVRALEASEATFSYAPVKVIMPNGKRPQTIHYHEMPNKNEMFYHMPFCHQSMFFRTAVLKKMSGYNTNYKNAGDYDLVLRICLEGHTAVLVNNKFVTYRTGGISDTRSDESFNEVAKIFYNNYQKLVPITEEECRQFYAKGLTKIPRKLAVKLQAYPHFFNYDIYQRLTELELQ